MGFRSDVLKKLEEKKTEKFLSNSLEARIVIRSNYWPTVELLQRYKNDLPFVFGVSQVEIVDETKSGPPNPPPFGRWLIEVQRADGKKCDRCWNYSVHVGENSRYPTVCERCSEAIAEIERDGGEAGAVGAKS
jgi:isoleucyl-tRNA synthetase